MNKRTPNRRSVRSFGFLSRLCSFVQGLFACSSFVQCTNQQIRRPATGMIQVTHAGPLGGSHHANASQTSYCRSERAGEIVEIASKWSAVSPQAMLPLSENPRLSWSNGTALHCCLASSLKPAVCSTYLSCVAPCDCRLGPIRTRTLHCHIASPRTEHAPRAGILYPSILFQSKVFPTP